MSIASRGWRSTTDWAARLRRNETFARIAANAGWLLGDRLVRAGIGFVVGAWVARYLGPERFGHYSYVLTLLAFFQTVAALGLDSIVVRDIARDPTLAPRLLGATLRLRMTAAMLCWAGVVGLAVVLDPNATETILMTAIVGGAMVFQAADTIDLWFQSQVQSRRTVVAKLIAYAFTNGLKVVLVLMKAPLIAFAATFLFDFAAAAIALAVAYRGFPTQHRWQFDGRLGRKLLKQSWPFLLSGLSIIIYIRIDLIMLKAMRGDYEVGIFSAALPLSQIWQMIPVTLAISFAPHIAQRKLVGEPEYEAALRKIFRLLAALGLAAAIVTALSASWLVPLIYGPKFAATVGVLQIHVFTNFFIALGVAQGMWIANEGRGKLLLAQTITGALVAIVGNLLVIPDYGAQGAAVIAILAQLSSTMLVNLFLAPRLFYLQTGISRQFVRKPRP